MPAHGISLLRIYIRWFCADAISDVLLESGVQGEVWCEQSAAEGSVSGPQSRVLTQNLFLLGRKRDGRGTWHTKDIGECFASSLEWKHKVLIVLFSKMLMSCISHMHSLRVIMLSAMSSLQCYPGKTNNVHKGPAKNSSVQQHLCQTNKTRGQCW